MCNLPAVTVTVYILPSFTKEGNSGKHTTYFAVLLNKPSSGTAVVQYKTSDGSAKACSDYQSAASTVTFSKGQWLKFIGVNVYGDKINESTKQFYVQLSSPLSGVKLYGNGKAAGTIQNDDGQCCGVTGEAPVQAEGEKAMQKAALGSMEVYPNPTSGNFSLQLKSQKAEAAQVLIVDGRGAGVESRKVALVKVFRH